MRTLRNAESLKRRNGLLAGVACWLATVGLAAAADEASAELPFIYDTWKTITYRQGLPHDSIRAIHVSGERVWVGTEGGLAALEGGAWRAWKHLDHEKRVPFPVISAIDLDTRTRDVWLGTWGEGLIRFSAGRFERFDQFNSGLAGNLVFSVAVTDGRVWAATNGGISEFDPRSGSWDLHLERRADALETALTTLKGNASNGSLYAGAWCGGLRRIDLERGEVSTLPSPPGRLLAGLGPSRRLDAATLAVDLADEVIWWTTRAHLFQRDTRGKWEVRRIGGRLAPGDFIYCLAARSETEAWLGTDRGLRVLADWPSDTWVTYRTCETGAQGLATVRREGNVLHARLLESAIPDNLIRCMAFQGDDVWVGTARGLAHGIGSGRWAGLQPGAANEGVQSCPAAEPPGQPIASEARPAPSKPVTIGVLSPVSKTVVLPGQRPQSSAALGRMDLAAVQLAIEQANARGGYRGLVPFELVFDVYGYAIYGWTMPEDNFATLAHRGDVRGMVAYLGPDSRFATATALRTEVPVVNAAPTPATADEAVNPWMFRCPGDDPVRPEKLLDHILGQLGHTRLAVLRTPGPEAKTHLQRYLLHARQRQRPPVADLLYDPTTGGLDAVLEAIQRSRAEVVLTRCDADVAAAILHEMRQAGMTQLFVGSEHIVTDEFVRLVGDNAGRVIALWNCSASGNETAAARFAESYAARLGRPPKPAALRCYDAARHLLQATDLAGLQREAIGRALREMSSAFMVRLDAGRWQFLGDSDQ
ncbi:MAG: ABC transporter substrate-binding protein [Planctomycetota bacterium]